MINHAECEADLIKGVLDLRADPDIASHITCLEPEAFMVPGHRAAWAAFQLITSKGGLIDSWAVNKAMRKLGASETDIQLADRYFNDAMNSLGSSDLRPRIAIVADAYRRRVVTRDMESLSQATEALPWAEVDARLAELAGKVAQAGNPRFREGTDHARQFEAFLTGKAILPPEARKNLIVFGVPAIDSTIMANPGRLIVVGGMPSAGKTAFAVQGAVETADIGSRVALGSLEMGDDEIAARAISNVAGVNSIHVMRKDGPPRPEFRPRFDQLRRNLVGLYGCAGDSWTAIEAAITREHRRSALAVAIIDYLQLMESPDVAKKRNDTEAQRIGEITKACKRLAQRLQINVVLLSQFNREVSEGQEPTLQNFLGSGQIERDADVALLLWNDSASTAAPVLAQDKFEERTIHCRIAKNRGGQRYGKVTMKFTPAINRFEEAETRETKTRAGRV